MIISVRRSDGPKRLLAEELGSDLALPIEQQRERLLARNGMKCVYRDESVLQKLLEQQVLRSPEGIAVDYGGQTLSYRELNKRANQLAHYLRVRGVGPEVFVGIYVKRSIEMIVGLLAILKAGGAYVPLDPSYPKRRLVLMLEDTCPSVLLTQRELLECLPKTEASIVALDAEWELISRHSEDDLFAGTQADDPAFVMYTSGSTGRPNGVVMKHRGVVNLVKQTDFAELGPDEVFLQLAPISFDASTFEIWGCLLNGGRLVVMPASIPSLDEIGRAITQNKVTTLWLTSSLFRLMVDTNLESMRGLRQLLTGGDVVPAAQARKVLAQLTGIKLINGYGPTETTTFACCYVMTDSSQVGQSVPIGQPITNTQAYVLDTKLRPVPTGTAGELYIGGDGLAWGYLNQPEMTAEKFVPNPFSATFGTRLYRTGDRARYLQDGNIEFLGRIDNQVKISGFRIELAEIEATLNQHPAVRDSVVLSSKDAAGEKRLVAYLVPNQGQEKLRQPGSEKPLHNERIQQWRSLYDDVIYRAIKSPTAVPSNPQFNITGWNSSYTGRPLSDPEMRAQVDQTVDRILALGPKRVLEIGCGTGLLLFRIAPDCNEYWATDFSGVALGYLRKQLDQLEQQLPRVTVWQRTADNFSGIEPESLDAVILNSVVQHFPDIGYLVQVLEAAIRVVRPGGSIFVGDVRSLPLLKAFHTSVQLCHSPSSLSTPHFQNLVRRQIVQEEELVIDPAFFTALQQHLPQVSRIKVQLKRGRHHNELTRFRYDAVIYLKEEGNPTIESRCLDWSKQTLTLEAVTQLLQRTQPEALVISNVPNARLATEAKAVELLESDNKPETIGQLRQILAKNIERDEVDPEDFWELGGDLPYEIEIGWSGSENHSCYDVLFKRRTTTSREFANQPALCSGSAATGNKVDWEKFANNPLQHVLKRKLVPELRSYLKDRLPEYMLPSAFVVMSSMPLNVNGKVDRSALRSNEPQQPAVTQPYVAPRTPIEDEITNIWEKVLGIDEIGVNDNFFEIGGNSLKAVQVVAQLRSTFNVELSTTSLFDRATVGALANVLKLAIRKGAWEQKVATNRQRGEERIRRKIVRRSSRMNASLNLP
jgi:amino acid adenylation domain-containing protein